ncbi:hypothetical protein BCV72DRAFT_252944 [Rhizopus microsporus var. microsporus]|uniref:Tc1-like transposase DDE domain-containing protein n=1 Tax=Rhizopus microsporus var. microsporus TaxID=86635 RepID=A0A1X0QPI9_RHIZD|nr:hypothetical protein BCV72DRAFT_252944 [Rhizopus microsporus var. microsporus]
MLQIKLIEHDNDPKHTAKVTKKNTISRSRPFEHIWRHLKLKLALYEQRARGVYELWERVKIEWNRFDADICCKYIDSMSARVKAVIDAKGGNAKY